MVAAKDGNLILLNPSTENLGIQRTLFNQKLGDDEIKAPLVAVGDSVYVGSQDRTVRRTDFKDGQRNVWFLVTKGGACAN